MYANHSYSRRRLLETSAALTLLPVESLGTSNATYKSQAKTLVDVLQKSYHTKPYTGWGAVSAWNTFSTLEAPTGVLAPAGDVSIALIPA